MNIFIYIPIYYIYFSKCICYSPSGPFGNLFFCAFNGLWPHCWGVITLPYQCRGVYFYQQWAPSLYSMIKLTKPIFHFLHGRVLCPPLSIVVYIIWQIWHLWVRATCTTTFSTHGSAMETIFLACAPPCFAVFLAATTDDIQYLRWCCGLICLYRHATSVHTVPSPILWLHVDTCSFPLHYLVIDTEAMESCSCWCWG